MRIPAIGKCLDPILHNLRQLAIFPIAGWDERRFRAISESPDLAKRIEIDAWIGPTKALQSPSNTDPERNSQQIFFLRICWL